LHFSFVFIIVDILILPLYDQNIFLLFFTFLFAICVVHLVVILVRLITQVVRKLEADWGVLERPHCMIIFSLLEGSCCWPLSLNVQLEFR